MTAVKSVRTVHAPKLKTCGKTHPEIKYSGSTCPACHYGKMVDSLRTMNAGLSAANAELQQRSDIATSVKNLSSELISRLAPLEAHICKALAEYAMKLEALDDGIAMLTNGEELPCEHLSKLTGLDGTVRQYRCVLQEGHIGTHIYSMKRPHDAPESGGN
jgi:hypothetical protein